MGRWSWVAVSGSLGVVTTGGLNATLELDSAKPEPALTIGVSGLAAPVPGAVARAGGEDEPLVPGLTVEPTIVATAVSCAAIPVSRAVDDAETADDGVCCFARAGLSLSTCSIA